MRGDNLEDMQINIHETTVKINDIKIFGVKNLRIGKDYFMIKKRQ